MSQGGPRTAEVIDLTNTDDVEEVLLDHVAESARRQGIPQPFGHHASEVIDLDAVDTNHTQIDSGSDLQFISERRIVHLPHESRYERHFRAQQEQPPPQPSQSFLQMPRLGNMSGLNFRQVMALMHNAGNAFTNQSRHPFPHRRAFPVPTTGLDYATPAFTLQHREPGPARTSPELEPLETRPGFTRSPREGDMLVCAACEDELCSGEDELKGQVWVIRGCGHVYCGRCAKIRTSTTSKAKGKANAPAYSFTPPYPQCAVPGCGQSTRSRTAMIQVFL